MEYLNESKIEIINLVKKYPDILRGYFNLENSLDVPGNTLKCAIDIVEVTRIQCFINALRKGEMTIEDFIENFKKYANKKQLIETIEKQRRSHSEILNILCALIIEDEFNNNKPFSYQQLYHINFLLQLTALDLYNLLKLYEINETKKRNCVKDNEGNVLSGVDMHEWSRLELGASIKIKLDNGGYNQLGTLGYISGEIHFTELYYDLMENRILKYFSLEDLMELIKHSS